MDRYGYKGGKMKIGQIRKAEGEKIRKYIKGLKAYNNIIKEEK